MRRWALEKNLRAEQDKDKTEEIGRPSTISCVVCHEPIVVGAAKCRHCHSYQGWLRRNLVFGSSTLPLLLAFISVLGIVAPDLRSIVVAWRAAPKADVQVSAYFAPGGMQAYVINVGTATATLQRSATIKAKEKGGKKVHNIGHFFNAADGSGLAALSIRPNEQKTFYLNRSVVTVEYPQLDDGAVCELRYKVQSANGIEDGISSFNCWK